jgi:hypothetical protein
MKKISSLIVCFALLAAGTAFALDLPDALKIPGLTVTGTVQTGLQVSGGTYDDFSNGSKIEGDRFNKDATPGALDPSVYAYSDDIGDGTPFRAHLQLVWERDNLGVKTRFRYQPNNGPVTSTLTPIYEKDKDGKLVIDPVSGDPIPTGEYSGTPATPDGRLGGTLNNLNNTVNKAFVYAYLWDKKIKVSAGKGTDEAWGLFYSSFGSGNTAGFDGQDGIKVEVKPIDGLNVGAFYGTSNLFASAYNGYSDQTATDRRLVVGAKYTSGLFKVVATTAHNFVEVDRNADLGVYNVYGTSAPTTPKDALKDVNIGTPLFNTSNLLVGVQVTPIEPLTVDLSVAAINLGSWTVGKAHGNDDNEITTGAGAYKKGDFNPYWQVLPKLKVSYALNEQLSFGLGIHDLQFADAWYTAEAGGTDPEENGMGLFFPITINPSVGYALSDDLSLSLDLNFKINEKGSDQFGIGFKPAAEFSLGSGAKFVVYDELTLYTKSQDIKDGNGVDTDYGKKHPYAASFGPLGGASGTTNTLQFDFVWAF